MCYTSAILLSLLFYSSTGYAPVQDEVARAAYIPAYSAIAQGTAELACVGIDDYKHLIYWMRNGVRVNSQFIDPVESNLFRAIHKVTTEEEAYYSCNGIGIYLVEPKVARATAIASVWQGSNVVCIDPALNEETSIIMLEGTGPAQTRISFKNEYDQDLIPMRERRITADTTLRCNNTEEFQFIAETRPGSSVRFEGKKIICSSTDQAQRCNLTIYFGDRALISGLSPEVTYTYKSINIQQVYCTSSCLIGEDIISLPTQSIEINRSLYIGVIFVIILIIILILILLCCILWFKLGFKEKYSYQINMRLKKNFAVDGNKLSSYRLSGVEAGADKMPDFPPEADDSDDDVKEVVMRSSNPTMGRRPGDDSDSFVDPNFANTNQKYDMRSKDDITAPPTAPTTIQRPFLRI